jgi:hypothetical protein
LKLTKWLIILEMTDPSDLRRASKLTHVMHTRSGEKLNDAGIIVPKLRYFLQ